MPVVVRFSINHACGAFRTTPPAELCLSSLGQGPCTSSLDSYADRYVLFNGRVLNPRRVQNSGITSSPAGMACISQSGLDVVVN